MNMKETYRSLMGCPNCVDIQELFIPVGMLKKDYVIPPEKLCTNCGCRLDGKIAPESMPDCDKCEHQSKKVLYCSFEPTCCKYFKTKR